MTNALSLRASDFVKMGLTGYDACYAALVKDLKGRWITLDKKAHNLVKKEKVSHYLSTGELSNG